MSPSTNNAEKRSVGERLLDEREAPEIYRPDCLRFPDVARLAYHISRVSLAGQHYGLRPAERASFIKHIDSCVHCLTDLRQVLSGLRSFTREAEAVDDVSAEVYMLEKLASEWTQVYPVAEPLVVALLQHARESVCSVAQTMAQGRPAHFVARQPMVLVDELLASALLSLRPGRDAYDAMTTIEFWSSLSHIDGSSEVRESQFYRATVMALLSGLQIRRLFPLSSGSRPYYLSEAENGFLQAHSELARRHRNYEIGLVHITDEELRESHCGIITKGSRKSAFVPHYDSSHVLDGLTYVPEAEATVCRFEDHWEKRIAVESLPRVRWLVDEMGMPENHQVTQ